MSEVVLDARILMPCHTEAEWQALDLTPKNREICISTDVGNGLYKIGDGVTPWSELSYIEVEATGSDGEVYQKPLLQTDGTTYGDKHHLLFTTIEDVIDKEFKSYDSFKDTTQYTPNIYCDITTSELHSSGMGSDFYTNSIQPHSDDPLEVLPPINYDYKIPVEISKLTNVQTPNSYSSYYRTGILNLKVGDAREESALQQATISAISDGKVGMKVAQASDSTSGVFLYNNGNLKLKDASSNTVEIAPPTSAQQNYFLRGDGTWAEVSTNPLPLIKTITAVTQLSPYAAGNPLWTGTYIIPSNLLEDYTLLGSIQYQTLVNYEGVTITDFDDSLASGTMSVLSNYAVQSGTKWFSTVNIFNNTIIQQQTPCYIINKLVLIRTDSLSEITNL